MSEEYWAQPLQWNAQAAKGRVGKDGKHWITFAGDMCDIFDTDGPADERNRMWQMMKQTPHQTWAILTKRPEHLSRFLPEDWGQGIGFAPLRYLLGTDT